jgi:hypothetical protein
MVSKSTLARANSAVEKTRGLAWLIFTPLTEQPSEKMIVSVVPSPKQERPSKNIPTALLVSANIKVCPNPQREQRGSVPKSLAFAQLPPPYSVHA